MRKNLVLLRRAIPTKHPINNKYKLLLELSELAREDKKLKKNSTGMGTSEKPHKNSTLKTIAWAWKEVDKGYEKILSLSLTEEKMNGKLLQERM